jgi:hypothetical protein
LSNGKNEWENESLPALSSRNLLPPDFFEREAESQEKGKRSSGDPGIFGFGEDINKQEATCTTVFLPPLASSPWHPRKRHRW